MPKEIFHDTFENLEITRICIFVRKTMHGDWMAKVVVFFFIKMLLTFGGRCNRCF